MANNLELPPENMLSSFALKQGMNENAMISEEFRNSQKIEGEIAESVKRQNAEKLFISRGITLKKLQAECNKLKEELKRTDVDLESYRRTFEAVTGELKKQLDLAKKRESESLAKTLCLRLENEKLHVLLESKQGLVDKLRKELLNVKRVLKFAIKDICNISRTSESFLSHEGPRSRGRRPRSARGSRSPRVRFADSLDHGLKTRDM